MNVNADAPEPVAFDHLSDRARPPSRPSLIEPPRHAVSVARAPRPIDQVPLGPNGSVAADQHPRDPDELPVIDPAGKALASEPGVGQLVIIHDATADPNRTRAIVPLIDVFDTARAYRG